MPPKVTAEYDVGTVFTKITVDDIVNDIYTDSSDKATVLALLDLFMQLHNEKDLSKSKRILKTITTMSGNSEEFSFLKGQDPSDSEIKRAKDKAREFYIAPYRLPALPKDKKLSKSLRDWHEHLKIVGAHPTDPGSWAYRGEAIKAFYASSDPRAAEDEVDPYGDTMMATIKGKR